MQGPAVHHMLLLLQEGLEQDADVAISSCMPAEQVPRASSVRAGLFTSLSRIARSFVVCPSSVPLFVWRAAQAVCTKALATANMRCKHYLYTCGLALANSVDSCMCDVCMITRAATSSFSIMDPTTHCGGCLDTSKHLSQH
eukprot:1145447-Pelagomonas_calceolata.AAC.2